MSVGRVLLLKWPPRYPDHLTFTTPAPDAPLAARRLPHPRRVPDAVSQGLPFAVNLYYFVEAERT